MDRSPKAFVRYAWFTLGYNVLVILWGVFLRASKSGDGCGQHWLTCNGEVLPSAPELKAVIEFSHRVMSAIDGVVVLALFVWAFFLWRQSRTEQRRSTFLFSAGSMFFVITEALVGAGLVLTGNTAEALTAARPFWMAGHLINTFVLLAFLALAARRAEGGSPLSFNIDRKALLMLGLLLAAILIVGTSGSVAALANMLFPSNSLLGGLEQDLSSDSNILVLLRPIHPLISIGTIVFLIFAADRLKRNSPGDKDVARWAKALSWLAVIQFFFGTATLLTHMPMLMQIGHLLLADLIWISFVMLAANTLSPQAVTLKSATRAVEVT
ncbi:MAG: cytochrome oxidase assembly [Acidobacteria bacterium OLB17]|nr:MAG: cytochrome oxidase assembly [Acidobacteria bacterium OLB17]MCZ2391104.1 COX15/CtaA family protein [Acidobacteriota bacterium]